MMNLKMILWSAACAVTLTGCDVSMFGHDHDRPVVVEQRGEVVEQRPVVVEQRHDVVVEPAAPIVDVHVH